MVGSASLSGPESGSESRVAGSDGVEASTLIEGSEALSALTGSAAGGVEALPPRRGGGGGPEGVSGVDMTSEFSAVPSRRARKPWSSSAKLFEPIPPDRENSDSNCNLPQFEPSWKDSRASLRASAFSASLRMS